MTAQYVRPSFYFSPPVCRRSLTFKTKIASRRSTRSFSARRARRSSVGATTTEETIYDHPGCATPLPPIIYRFLSCPLLSYIGRLRCIFQTTQCSKPLSPPSRAQPRDDEPNSEHEDAGECWMCRVLRENVSGRFFGEDGEEEDEGLWLPAAPARAGLGQVGTRALEECNIHVVGASEKNRHPSFLPKVHRRRRLSRNSRCAFCCRRSPHSLSDFSELPCK